MKFPLISLGLLTCSTIVSLLSSGASPASAACVMVDPAVQVAVHGSQMPAQQTNNVTMQSDGRCLGAVTTNVGEQVYVGPGSVTQNRDSSHYTGGDPSVAAGTEPVIGVPVYVPVDVYAPAYDPQFYGNLPYTGYSSDSGYAGYPTGY